VIDFGEVITVKGWGCSGRRVGDWVDGWGLLLFEVFVSYRVEVVGQVAFWGVGRVGEISFWVWAWWVGRKLELSATVGWVLAGGLG